MVVNMKIFSGLVVFIALSAISNVNSQKTISLDDLDVNDFLQNARLLRSYMKCILDKGPCTKEAATIKKTIPEALSNNCKDCSEKQKSDGEIIFKHLIEKEPAIYKEVEEKYDKDGKYRREYYKLEEKLKKDIKKDGDM